jgi:hypothetical protein
MVSVEVCSGERSRRLAPFSLNAPPIDMRAELIIPHSSRKSLTAFAPGKLSSSERADEG